jgi:hypothetical protein
MTIPAETAELRPPQAAPSRPAEDDERYRRALLAALRVILKRRIITLYCFGFLDVRQTQKLIDTFSLWEA